MPTARSGAVRAAAQVLGGPASLASILGVSELQLEQWINGKESVPTEVFLRVVDLLERYDRRKEPRSKGNDTQPGHG